MGVKNLWDVLESCKKTHPLHHLRNKRVCVDLSCWVVQLQNVNKGNYCTIKEKLYLRGLFHRIRALIALNCSLIFVTDGSIPAIKLATYRQRLNSGSEVCQDETDSQKPQALRRNMGSEFSRMIKEAKGLGLAMGIPCLDGVEEAEAQCALLNSESLCDGCFTSDSDAFLFGARTVYRDICLGEGGHVICYEMADIESKLGFGRNSLITLALILGSDYSRGVHGLGPESACKIVKSVGDDKILQLIESEGLFFIEKKGTKRQTKDPNCKKLPSSLNTGVSSDGGSDNVHMKHQLLEVIEAYLKPKCHSADSGAVYQVLSQHPFQRAKLHQICMNFFEWPPEKTDEYILPKVAERDLRRYANLRSASSEAGLVLPISEIPVRCPVSEVVKPRKIQGGDSFEVLWEGVDGLETSVVPADLIQSACPEKIAAFEERKAAKKKDKRKPRLKKLDKVSALAEINSDLQTLILDIESGNNTTSIPWPSRTDILADHRNAASVDSESKNTGSNSTSYTWSSRTATLTESSNAAAVDSESKNSDSNSTSAAWSSRTRVLTDSSDAAALNYGKKSTVDAEMEYISNKDIAMPRFDPWRNLAKNEFIDLLSPSPPARPRKVSRCQQGSRRQDVSAIVELSDSDDGNLSPEHARKAQELRLFISSIKDGL